MVLLSVSNWVEAFAVVVPLLAVIIPVWISQSRQSKKLSDVKNQVTNDHATSDSPANLRVQMDQMQSQIREIQSGHTEFRENILMLITELRTVQKQNGELMNQLAAEDRRLANRIDHFMDRQNLIDQTIINRKEYNNESTQTNP